MKVKTTKMVEQDVIVTTCDSCGKEIGRNHRGDYEGYCCSVCGRQFCYDCHKKVTIHDEDLLMHVCPICMNVENGALEKMKGLDAIVQSAMDERVAARDEWKGRSKPNNDGE